MEILKKYPICLISANSYREVEWMVFEEEEEWEEEGEEEGEEWEEEEW